MNIGETDADGWTYVRFGDAAKAAQEGTHEVESRIDAVRKWNPCVGGFYDCWQYRTREKARTITVTHVRPTDVSVTIIPTRLVLDFESIYQRSMAYKAIRDAMGQS